MNIDQQLGHTEPEECPMSLGEALWFSQHPDCLDARKAFRHAANAAAALERRVEELERKQDVDTAKIQFLADDAGIKFGEPVYPAPAKECIDGPNPTQRCGCDRGPAHAEGDGCARSCEAHAPPEAGQRRTLHRYTPAVLRQYPQFSPNLYTECGRTGHGNPDYEHIEVVPAAGHGDGIYDCANRIKTAENMADALRDKLAAAEAREKGLRELLGHLKNEGMIDWQDTHDDNELKREVEAALAEKEEK